MRKIRNIIKEKAGVSPIIAIILMVAITVVLAATIYVWVSGMGKSGQKAPNLSCNVDNIYDKVTITDVEAGTKWNDIKVIIDGDVNSVDNNNTLVVYLYTPGNTSSPYTTLLTIDESDDIPTSVDMNTIVGSGTPINSGDYFKIAVGKGNPSWDYISITLVYKPTNTNLGTWTVYS